MKKIALLSILILLCFSNCSVGVSKAEGPSRCLRARSFSVASDMRNYTGCSADYLRGACETLASGGPGRFMVSAGDIDPPDGVFADIRSYIGRGYTWYPVVGNHESETASDMAWPRSFNRNGTRSPTSPVPGCAETAYSFDDGNVHFVVLNRYCDAVRDDAADGDVPDPLYDWLVSDLAATAKPTEP